MDHKQCRLCSGPEANLNIFQSAKEVQIITKIEYCCKSVSIQEYDGLPSNICRSCDCELEACFRFLLKCEAAEKNLRSLIKDPQIDHKSYISKTEVKSEDCADIAGDAEALSFEELKSEHINSENLKIALTDGIHRKRPRKKRITPNKVDFNCSVCGRKCSSTSALVVHMRIHTNEKPFPCPSCDKKYTNNSTLKRHEERNHLQHRERRFICENCGKGFYSKNDIKIHMRVHTGETPFVCSICLMRFNQNSALLRHKKRHIEEKSHVCTTCGKSFWTKEELKKHLSVHDDVRHYACPICNVQFKQKNNIKKHMLIHSDPNRFVCNHCGQTFNQKGNLKSHIDRKHSEKSGYCNICCKNMSNIEIHMWRHTGQRPLKCEYCPSSFYAFKSLALHISFKHRNTDKYKCTMEGCVMSFPSKPMLAFHVAKYHEMQTPYPCDRCARGFYRKNDLARHKIGTHKERLL